MIESEEPRKMPVFRNPRHEKFSQLVASGIKPTESYTAVGYKPMGAKQAASRLLTKVDVRERVSELQEAAARSTAEAVILNRERVLNWLSQLSHEAQQKGHYSAAARCEELIGKEIGMFVDRSDHTLLWSGNLDDLNESQLEQVERSLVQRYNQLVQLGAGTVVIEAEATPVETSRCID